MAYKVVVVGATGNVGREMLNILAEREFPLADIAAVASPRSTGDIIDFGETGRELKVRNIEHFDFAGWDIALFAAGSGPAKEYAPKAAAAGRIRAPKPGCSNSINSARTKPRPKTSPMSCLKECALSRESLAATS